MTTHPYLQHGLTILHARLKTPQARFADLSGPPQRPFITLSRETCAGATTLGRHLLPLLNEQLGEEGRSWMFLDKDLLHHALQHHHLPEQLAVYLPEDRLPEIKGLLGEMVGLHPPLWELEHRVAEAIHRFAELGHVILAGRAANLITRDLPAGLHLRLVASMESRVRRARAAGHEAPGAAEEFVRQSDLARARHVRTMYDRDIADPCAYDLVINTDRLSATDAARLVVDAMTSRIAAVAPAK